MNSFGSGNPMAEAYGSIGRWLSEHPVCPHCGTVFAELAPENNIFPHFTGYCKQITFSADPWADIKLTRWEVFCHDVQWQWMRVRRVLGLLPKVKVE